ncbi:ATP-binding cassette domain-containing protein [Gilvimarinus agarilyticus]|uniref:ATP-binding cassette domain-containing protein n=1 Tax=Gilvimarinus sp. 2_MG-2023 TaxID=3062666 RepID=UPI001C08063F|nr:ATP-binding cassette domain-containing protein [Gilvimarinus sp. 2_MG-2023]MBU2886561.1 ATP-binding cassette domain-containing protein [Gilvimarinus agarilyticus]MDO6571229.1 ATP-binding cassette domain-containing protein [Gilvimarinus sp. 2_MG-2023]
MQQKPALLAWFNDQVAQQGVAPRNTLLLLTAIKCARALALILAFWFIADILASWITAPVLGSSTALTCIFFGLLFAWLLQGAHGQITHRAKAILLGQLEQRLMDQFVSRQHALIRQHSHYYWQSVWLKHLPALVDWRYDYLVQQRVAALMPVFTLIAVAVIHPIIGAALVLSLPVVPLFMIVVGKGAARLHRKHFVALERLGSLFGDRLKALPLLASFQAYDKQQALLQQASDQLSQRTMKVVGVAFLSSTVLDFFSTLAVALVAVLIGFSLLGEINIGAEVSLHEGLWVLLTVPMLLSEMKLLGQFYHQKAQAEAAQQEVKSWLVPATEEPPRAKWQTFNGVDLTGFSMQKPTLNADNLSLKVGDWVRLDGVSGAGKTAFLEALGGLREASCRLNANFVLLSQQAVVLPYSLRDNLACHQPFEDDALWQVLDQVGLADWARALPQQLNTLMGEYPPLSGGEAQRLTIARLLLQEADVWLLDEPTAHLSESQHLVIADLLRRCCAAKTVIWASHKSLPEHWFNQNWRIQGGLIRG